MSRRATELQQGLIRAGDRLRFAQRMLDQYSANYPPRNDETEERTRRKLIADRDRAQSDQDILRRALQELAPI